MPEGDTIFRAASTLHRALAGERVVRFASPLPRLSRVDEDRPIAGRAVEEVRAAGKHLLVRFSGDLVLRTHLRMNGSWHLYRPGERWRRAASAMRVLIETAPWVAVGFDLPVAEWVEARALARHPVLARLGPDLLAPQFDVALAARHARARPDEAIGDVLLNQRVVAGIGNVFKSEILFLAAVDPARTVGSLSDAELSTILALARKLLRENVGDAWPGGRRTTGRMDPSQRLWVYGRAGDPCRRCGTPIALEHGAGARLTFRCPRCQPRPEPHGARR